MTISNLEHLEVISEETNVTGGIVLARVSNRGFAKGPHLAIVVSKGSGIAISLHGAIFCESSSSSLSTAQ